MPAAPLLSALLVVSPRVTAVALNHWPIARRNGHPNTCAVHDHINCPHVIAVYAVDNV